MTEQDANRLRNIRMDNTRCFIRFAVNEGPNPAYWNDTFLLQIIDTLEQQIKELKKEGKRA